MGIGTDTAKVKVDLDTQQAEVKLKDLSIKARDLKKQIKAALETGSQESASKLKKELNGVEKEMDDVRRSIDQVARVLKNLNGASLKDLTKAQIALNMQIRNSSRATAEERAELKKKAEQLKQVRAQMKLLNVEYMDMKERGFTDDFADFFNKYSQGIVMVSALLGGFAMTIAQILKSSGEVTDELARIQKTTDMTTQEVNNLNNAFKKLDTRTSVSDLRAIAIIGGQLGIVKNDILGFTKSIDMLSVALGDEFKGGSEEIANTLGKLRNVLTDRRTANVGEDLLRIGNALNVLGAEGMATGDVVSDFANRIGGIGIPLGMTTPQVLGLSASLQEMGVSTERGATAVVKILQKMSKETDTFAKIAGMNSNDFYRLVNTNITEAFLKVAEGAKNSGREATSLSEIIKELEIQGAGASEVFAKVGGNIDLVRQKITTSGEAIKNTSSITREYNIMNETLGAKLEKLNKDFNRLMSSQFVQNFAKGMTNALIGLVNWLKNLPDLLNKYSVALSALVTVVAAYVAVQKKDFLIRTVNNVLLKQGIGLKIKEAVVLRAAIIQEQVLLAWRSKTTLATKLAAAAAALFNNTLAMHPIGWLVLSIGALITIGKAYNKYNAEAVALEEKKINTMFKLKNLIDQTKDMYDKLSVQVEKFVTLSKKERDAIVQTTIARLVDLKAQMSDKTIKRNTIYSTVFQREFSNFTRGRGPTTPEQQKEAEATWRKRATEKALDAVKELDEASQELLEGIKNIEGEYDKMINILNSEELGDRMGTENSSMLQKKLEYYRQALSILTQGTEDYIRVVGKIKQTQKLLDQYNIDFSPTDDAGKTMERKEKDRDKYLKFVEDTYNQIKERIRDHYRDVEQLHMDSAEREIAAIREKYRKDLLSANQMIGANLFNPANAAELAKWRQVYTDLITAMNEEIAAKEVEQAEELEKKKLDIRKKYGLISIAEERKLEIDELRKAYQGALLTYEEYIKKVKELNARWADDEQQKKRGFKEQYGLLNESDEEEYEIDKVGKDASAAGITDVEDIEAAKEKVREKYRKLREERDKDYMDKRLQMMMDEIEKSSFYVQSFTDFFGSMKELELSMAGDNEEKKKKIAQKYADIELSLTISRIFADTASAIMKAQAQLGAFALPAQVLIGATGVVQAGIAIAERNKIRGMEKGGYTGGGIGIDDGDGKEIAGVVHPDEYVIPAWERRIPMIANFERIIEAIRVNRGFSQGGGTTREIIKSEPVYMSDKELLSAVRELNVMLGRGIQAKLVANEHYLKEHNKAQQKLTDIKNESTI